MILSKVTFGSCGSRSKAELEEVAESYLQRLIHSGQLCGGGFMVAWTEGQLNAYVMLAGPKAYELRYHSNLGKKYFEEVIETFGKEPVWMALDDDAGLRVPSWKKAPFLYLFTHPSDWASPVCRGDGKKSIPQFALPITFEQKDELYHWQRSYHAHDDIWLGSGALEENAYRQLADPASKLSQGGRELCRIIEGATKIPTFYYLMRFWGRKQNEANRRCPGCGNQWNITCDESHGKTRPFWMFDFMCDPCRLVSHLADVTGGHASIGEFRKK